MIKNYSADSSIYVRVFPIGAIFNGRYEYSLKCKYSLQNYYDKIIGGDTILQKNLGIPSQIEINHDFDLQNGSTQASIGFGKYRIEFYHVYIVGNDTLIDSLPIDYCDIDYSDYNYPYSSIPNDPLHYFPYHTNDIVIHYYNSDSITYHWTDDLIPENRLIRIWDQQVRNPLAVKNQSKGGFINDTFYNYIPINAVDSGATAHFYPNNFYLNMEIKYSTEISKLISYPTILSLKNGAIITIDTEKVLDIVEFTPLTDSTNFDIRAEANGGFVLEAGSELLLRRNNKIVFEELSKLYLGNNAQITVEPGAILCNYGASIRGNGIIFFKGGLHYQGICNQLADYLIQDSVKFALDSNAVVSIPNNTTLHFRGNTTSLIMNPGSKLLFGENSGIVCDSGGKIIANNATFTSIDSTKKWN